MQIKTNNKDYDIGVIIGRFQINSLHDAHIDLIQSVLNRHKKVILFLGVSLALSTKRNPLDFPTRKAMIEEVFGTKLSAILPLYDCASDSVWSKQIDLKIREVYQLGSVVLYGSKDSFIPYYKGSFDCLELEPTTYVSATDVRTEISKEIVSSKEFRSGVIYSVYNSYPIVYSTVDVAILNEEEDMVLLARKPNENKYRFVGGFVDNSDKDLEQAAKRECMEETGIEVTNPKYVGSFKMSDWRYKNEPGRSILTSFFIANKIFGQPNPQDDIEELKWFNINDLNVTNVVESHLILLNKLKTIKAF